MMDINFKRNLPKNTTGNSNEPPICTTIKVLGSKVDITKYPPMGDIYIIFSNITGFNKSNFILTNGCEEAMGIVCRAVKPKMISLSTPTWGFIDVLSNQYDILLDKHNFVYDLDEDIIVCDDTNLPLKGDMIYCNQEYNNWFKTRDYTNNIVEYGETIVNDFTYLNIFEESTINKIRKALSNNQIIVGSLSKFFGAGIRLGFIIANDYMFNKYKFEIFRPNFLNSLVYPVLRYYSKNTPKIKNKYMDFYSYESIVTNHFSYISTLSKNIISDKYVKLKIKEKGSITNEEIIVNRYSKALK